MKKERMWVNKEELRVLGQDSILEDKSETPGSDLRDGEMKGLMRKKECSPSYIRPCDRNHAGTRDISAARGDVQPPSLL